MIRCANSVYVFKKVFDNIEVFKIKGEHFILQSYPFVSVAIVVNQIGNIRYSI